MRTSADYAYGGDCEFISDTAAHTGTFKYGYCASDVVIAALTPIGRLTGNTVVGATFKAGTTIPISFSSITLTSGSLWAVRGN